jgi:hypothetical protein
MLFFGSRVKSGDPAPHSRRREGYRASQGEEPDLIQSAGTVPREANRMRGSLRRRPEYAARPRGTDQVSVMNNIQAFSLISCIPKIKEHIGEKRAIVFY